MRTRIASLIVLTLIAMTSHTNAAIINFSGTGTISRSDFTLASPSLVKVIEEIQGNAKISYTITVSTDSGDGDTDNVSLGSLGFGDSGNGASLEHNQESGEELVFTISAVTAEGLNGYNVTNNDVAVNFVSFFLKNNGAQDPGVAWSIAGGDSGAESTDQGETVFVTGLGTVLTTRATGAFSWINDVQTSYSGTVTVEAIPEPTSLALYGLGGLMMLGWGLRKKR